MTSNYNITIKVFETKEKNNAADASMAAAFRVLVIL
jgi:hypothetical protein